MPVRQLKLGTEKIRFTKRSSSGLTWSRYARVAKLLSRFDFGCRFNARGLCKRERRLRTNNKQCCCGACAANAGYLKCLPVKARTRVKRAYEKTDGFWRPKRGCLLPVDFRSVTCLLHRCSPERSRFFYVLEALLEDARYVRRVGNRFNETLIAAEAGLRAEGLLLTEDEEAQDCSYT